MPAAGAAKPGARPSIRDVARRAGVSPGCVSNVINRRRRQDDPIGRAVLEAVEALGYRANSMAANLRRSQSRIIGLIIPDFENPFFAELVARLERCAEATNYRIVATSSRESAAIERREVDELVAWRVAGVLLIPSRETPAEALVSEDGTPFVVLDRLNRAAPVDSIGVDNIEASADLVRRLIALGHRRILVAHLGDAIDNVTERLDGVRRAAGEHGQAIEVEYLATGPTVESARERFEAHLDTARAPTAIFCLHNLATLAAYGVARARGLEIGRDVALAGFDDSSWMDNMHPGVAAIVQPVGEIAEAAWARLLARIEGDDSPPGITRVRCHLEARGTLIRPPPG